MDKILVVNPFGAGDVLFSTPVVRALKQRYPDSFIGYLCNREVEALLKENPAIDELFFYTRGDFKKIRRKSYIRYVKTFFKALNTLRARKFDLVVDLSLVNQYSFIFWLIGIKKRFGFDYKKRGRFLTDKILVNSFKHKHVVKFYRDLLFKLGISDFKEETQLFLADFNKQWGDSFWEKQNLADGQLLVGLAAFGGASWGQNAASKQWPLERFARVAKRIIERYQAKIIIFGTAQDKESGNTLEKAIDDENVINVTGQTTLGQLAALISRLNIFIGNDSGPLHIACALKIKTISIFGPVDHRVYGPVGDRQHNVMLYKDINCRPCYKNFKTPDCKTMNCLLAISENDVWKAVETLL